jgi:multicomponent Na+:H+ antiporter subunit D
VLVAALCVGFGLVPGALFAILPFDVTSERAVAHVYRTYTVAHVLEGLALAAIGVVCFVAIKRPLSSLGRVPDIDRLYNPAAFYGTQALVVGVTELYAAVDRAAVATARFASLFAPAHGDPETEQSTGIGASILLVMLVLVGTLVVLVL